MFTLIHLIPERLIASMAKRIVYNENARRAPEKGMIY